MDLMLKETFINTSPNFFDFLISSEKNSYTKNVWRLFFFITITEE